MLANTELEAWMSEHEHKLFHVKQLLKWLYKFNVNDFEEMTDLSKSLRFELESSFDFLKPSIETIQKSTDKTTKFLIKLYDGNFVECVGIPGSGKLTICISTQVGCPMNCAFCSTARLGFIRNLGVGEIIYQVILVQEHLKQKASNLVLMGEGEPFCNFDNVKYALDLINSKDLLNIGARHITLSTCGILDKISDFAALNKQYTLAISLHSAVQETRNLLMPNLKNQPLARLKRELSSYIQRTNRRISFEYLLLKGINDDERHLNALIDYSKDLLSHVNLLEFNPFSNNSLNCSLNLKKSENTAFFQRELEKAGIPATIRISRGKDIAAACGQLVSKLH
ncbi:MAG: 23S rRNA (adenine(2503)-C(2))-methyltransferase RlmN [Coriobacteriales bacterium]|nr:23S rRNA (adenine(2503)-C(2))-methyltransferase RlmN [Coriobacteriales bacterium]